MPTETGENPDDGLKEAFTRGVREAKSIGLDDLSANCYAVGTFDVQKETMAFFYRLFLPKFSKIAEDNENSGGNKI